MQSLGITHNGEYYECGEMHFDHLPDAVNFAKELKRFDKHQRFKLSLGDKLSVNVLPEGVLLKAARRSYSLADLVAQCDLSAPEPADLAAWSEVKPVGREAW